MGNSVNPIHMALCRRCAERIGQTYGERLEDFPGVRDGVCGFCSCEAPVQSFDLWPRSSRISRPGTGGGERSRAGCRP